MKKNLLFNSLFLILLGCKDEHSLINCKGIPNLNQAFSYMHFKTDNEGYLFGTYTEYEELSEKELEDLNNIPRATSEANIYKTTDGGENWVKINSVANHSYFNIATQLNDEIYILQNDVSKDYKFSIAKFCMKNENIENFKNTKPISAIWSNYNKLYYTNNRGIFKLYALDNEQNLDSLIIENYALSGLSLNDSIFSIFSNKETTYFGRINEESKEIPLPIIPKSMTLQDGKTILIAGKSITNKNEISLVSYDLRLNQPMLVKKFKDYSIIENLQSNDKVIIGFIGNVKGVFTEFDLLYSLDNGRTWQIKKLEEPNYVGPSSLIDNIVYIYSGGSRIQRIVLY